MRTKHVYKAGSTWRKKGFAKETVTGRTIIKGNSGSLPFLLPNLFISINCFPHLSIPKTLTKY